MPSSGGRRARRANKALARVPPPGQTGKGRVAIRRVVRPLPYRSRSLRARPPLACDCARVRDPSGCAPPPVSKLIASSPARPPARGRPQGEIPSRGPAPSSTPRPETPRKTRRARPARRGGRDLGARARGPRTAGSWGSSARAGGAAGQTPMSGARPAPPSSGPRMQGCAMAQWHSGRCASPTGPPSAGVEGAAAARRARARNLRFRVGACTRGAGGPCRARDIFQATPISSRRLASGARDPPGDFLRPAQNSRAARVRFFTSFNRRWDIVSRGARVIVAKAAPPRSSRVGANLLREILRSAFRRGHQRALRYVLCLSTWRAKRAERFSRCTAPRAKRAAQFLRVLHLGARSALNNCQCLQLGARGAWNGFRYLQFGARSPLGGLATCIGRRRKRAERFATCTVLRAKRAKRFAISTPARRARGRWILAPEFAASPSPGRSGPAAFAGVSGAGRNLPGKL